MDGRRFAPGDVLEGILAGVPVVLEEVVGEALSETVAWSGWFHRRKPEALVVVWPSTGGLFAWQPGAPEALNARQPPTWRMPIRHVGGLEPDPAWDFPIPPDRQAFSCTHVIDEGHVILWVAREVDDARGEDWTAICGSRTHDAHDIRAVHLAHLVRSAPSLRRLTDLALDESAARTDVYAPWIRARLS